MANKCSTITSKLIKEVTIYQILKYNLQINYQEIYYLKKSIYSFMYAAQF